MLHVCSEDNIGALAERLGESGYTVRREILYAGRALALSQEASVALSRGEIDAALFFSPRNAASFVRLAAGLDEGCKHMVAVALSSAVAEKLAALPWRRVAVAAAPHEADLLAALDSCMAAP